MYRSWTKRTTLLLQKAIPDKWYSSTVEQLSLPGVEEHLKKHPLQPHQMSRAQYEADPQTMWRAEGSDTLGGSRPSWKSSGLHFGDYAAAKERGESLSRYDHIGGTRPLRMLVFGLKGASPTSQQPVIPLLKSSLRPRGLPRTKTLVTLLGHNGVRAGGTGTITRDTNYRLPQ